MPSCRGLMLAMAAVLLSGCTIIPGLHVQVPAEGDPPTYDVLPITAEVIREQRARQQPQTLDAALPLLHVDQQSDEYRVGPGDVLSIIVWEHPELTTPAGEFRDAAESGRLIDAEGRMFYPYVGMFHAGGQSVAEIREFITEFLSQVIRNPQVDVRVSAFRAHRVQVTGEVRQPGLVTLNDTPKGVLEAINERGGLTAEASRRQALLLRDGGVHAIDLAGMLTGAVPARNLALRAGDVLHVPDAAEDQVFVLGEVGEQAPLIMRQRTMTLTQALAGAGGINRLSGNDGGVVVFRRADGAASMPVIYVLDMSRPEGMLLAGEFELQPRDVVYVKATAFAKYNQVIAQMLPTITSIFQLDRVISRR